MKKSLQPIFIFSLPKAGSTLLQRMLGASSSVFTTAEPWILLPHLYSLKSGGIAAEYWHRHAVHAIEDFCVDLPLGKKDYLEELRQFALTLYRKRAPDDCRYFLDKSPRYHLICDEIIQVFPDAKFIFLWRNPLAITSSIIRRWCNGKWKISTYNVDLYKGIENLVKAYNNAKTEICSVKYEDLVRNPAGEVHRICDYLELTYSDNMIESFYDTPLTGRMAEHTGSSIYKNSISKASLDTWKKTFYNPYRYWWAKRYLEWIGRHRLNDMGYDIDEVRRALSEDRMSSGKNLLSDLLVSAFIQMKIRMSPLAIQSGESCKMQYL